MEMSGNRHITDSLNTVSDFQENPADKFLRTDSELFENWEQTKDSSFREYSELFHGLGRIIQNDAESLEGTGDKAITLLNTLRRILKNHRTVRLLVAELTQSWTRPKDFLDTMMRILSSGHEGIANAGLSLLAEVMNKTSSKDGMELAGLDLVETLMDICRPWTLRVDGNEEIHSGHLSILSSLLLASSFEGFEELNGDGTIVAEKWIETVSGKVLLPAEQYIRQTFENGVSLSEGNGSFSFMGMLIALLKCIPYHPPVSEFVVRFGVVECLQSILSLIDSDYEVWFFLDEVSQSLYWWGLEKSLVIGEGGEVARCLCLEGLEDALEQLVLTETGGSFTTAIGSLAQSMLNTVKGGNSGDLHP
ncbi:hypothetical protein BLNAU_6785 [Blattamonas nauphoetae]|uniref:Uncharacterized protein n=1 Tax=Blattamonas nauphoetae TaxID=2049346 RepID=A0ABQ9Y3M8_9EUKA|nr:hypothetical protein BLNAU_6785 [Blattamonas nauphoetae]